MNTSGSTRSNYKPVRRDLLQGITSLFMPARTSAALVAAAKALARLSAEERLDLAMEAEREYAASLSRNALARYEATAQTKSPTTA